jgi:hypothetical protein
MELCVCIVGAASPNKITSFPETIKSTFWRHQLATMAKDDSLLRVWMVGGGWKPRTFRLSASPFFHLQLCEFLL